MALSVKTLDGERAASKVISEWTSGYVSDACHAANQIGSIHAGGLLSLERAKNLVELNFGMKKVDPKHRSTVYGAFENGRATEISSQEVKDRYFKVVANDNAPLPEIDPRDWQDKPVPTRKWFVEGWIPDRTVTNLSGDGGSGKTEILLQLIAASSLRTQWFGKDVSAGPCLYYGAEDEFEELHIRLKTIVAESGRQLSDLDGVTLISMAGLDAVLAEPDRHKNLTATDRYMKLVSRAKALRPKLIVIDPSADVFGGDEINRGQVRKFISMLRGLAMEIDCAVILSSHPSIAGMISGTGTSGSTGWSNSVRSRLYLEVTSPETRNLKLMKANHGKTGEKIEMRWQDGIYVLDDGNDPLVETLVKSSIDRLFLELLALFNEQGQNFSTSGGKNYAPAKMAEHPKAKGFTKKQLAASMQRLLDSKRIKLVTEGSASRRRTRLVIAEPATVH
jgi:RecA-family ATPase